MNRRAVTVAFERIRSIIRQQAPERDVGDEIAFHVEMETNRLIARGVSTSEARTAALQRFGDVDAVRVQMETIANQLEADMRGADLLDEVKQDIRYGVRALARSPMFTMIALVTIAIGVGATTAMFSVVNAVLFAAVPYPTASRIVVIANGTGLSKGDRTAVSSPEFADIGEQSRSMDGVAAVRDQMTTVVGGCAASTGCEPSRSASTGCLQTSLMSSAFGQYTVARSRTPMGSRARRGSSSSGMPSGSDGLEAVPTSLGSRST